MEGNPSVKIVLGSLLTQELSARHQYLAHEAWARDRGYPAFADIIQKRGEQEGEHADEILARIYQLNGTPDMTRVADVLVGDSPVSVLDNDNAAEQTALDSYNAAILIAHNAGDFVTRALLEHIIAEENAHKQEIEALISQATAMTLPNFLSTLTGR
jgi:bacterioferritin